MEEIWKPLVGYEEFYIISNFGRLRSLRVRPDKDMHQRIVKRGRGYMFSNIQCQNKRINLPIHRSVAYTFIGPRPKGLLIDHIDNNSLNNRVDNLEYVTPRENTIRGRSWALRETQKFKAPCIEKLPIGYVVTMSFKRREITLGVFPSEELAAEAYFSTDTWEKALELNMKYKGTEKSLKTKLDRCPKVRRDLTHEEALERRRKTNMDSLLRAFPMRKQFDGVLYYFGRAKSHAEREEYLNNLTIDNYKTKLLDYQQRRDARRTSKTKGVCFDRRTNKWVAHRTIEKLPKIIGRFKTEEDAIQALKT